MGQADDVARGTIVSRMTDAPRADGYYVMLAGGRVQVNLVKRWLDDSIRVETKSRIEPGEWRHVAVTYDGSRVASGIKVYLDGEPQPLQVHLDFINQSFASKEPLRIGAGGGAESRFRGRIDDARVYAAALSPDQVGWIAVPESIREIVAMPPAERSPRQAGKLRAFFLAEAAPRGIAEAHRRVADLRRRRERMIESFPTLMVMQEMATPRQAHVLIRGEYNRPGEPVSPESPPAAAAAARRAAGPSSAWPAGSSRARTASPPRRRQPLLGRRCSAGASSRHPRTSAHRGSGRAHPTCSTGSPLSSSNPAGT